MGRTPAFDATARGICRLMSRRRDLLSREEVHSTCTVRQCNWSFVRNGAGYGLVCKSGTKDVHVIAKMHNTVTKTRVHCEKEGLCWWLMNYYILRVSLVYYLGTVRGSEQA